MPPLRYVILWHDGVPQPHFDLMFETLPGSALSPWRCPRWPVDVPTSATRLKDHRRAYLEYEGDLSDRRGRVTRVAGGDCELDIEEGGMWNIRLTTGAPPTRLMLRQIDGANWIAEPSDHRSI